VPEPSTILIEQRFGTAALGWWLGAFLTITFLHRPPGGQPVGASLE
jgi:hypothetical protein